MKARGVRTIGSLLAIAAIVTATSVLSAQDAEAKRILARYEAMRPSAAELGMYRLDWAASLDDALERAAREGRPIFLVVIHAKYGDITGGHC